MKPYAHKIIAILFSLASVAGCAISMAGTKEKITIENHLSNNGIAKNSPIKFACDAKLYSIMLSVIIPLPPIIPVPNDNKAKLMITMPKGIDVKAFITKNNSITESELLHIKEQEPHLHRKRLVWIYPINYSCKNLENSQLRVIITNKESGEHKERTYNLKYSNEGLKLNFGYLGA